MFYDDTLVYSDDDVELTSEDFDLPEPASIDDPTWMTIQGEY